MKKKFYLVLDVETANSIDDPLVYDIGGAICDKRGNVYDTFSFVISDIFDGESKLMENAYYCDKLMLYYDGLRDGLFVRKTLFEAKQHIAQLVKTFGVQEVFAYNAYFDRTALNKTQRWLTKSKYRYFLPYGVKVNCIWHMACQVICTQRTYARWCVKNGLYKEKSGNLFTNAETVYAYISNQDHFEEQHTGLSDVLIEVAILAHCFKQHKAMDRSINRLCWKIPQLKAVAE